MKMFNTCLNGSVGASEVTDMWIKHYQQLYNSVSDSDAMDSLLRRISDMGNGGRGDVNFTVKDVVDACDVTQKTGKAVGLDGISFLATFMTNN